MTPLEGAGLGELVGRGRARGRRDPRRRDHGILTCPLKCPPFRAFRPLIVLLVLAALSGLGCTLTGVLQTPATPTPEATETPSASPPPISPPDSPPTAGDTPAPTRAATYPPPALEAVSFRGVSFSYDPALAGLVNAQVIEAVPPEDNPLWLVAPEHVQFTFVDYVLQEVFHEPAIYVYPAAEYAAASESAAEQIAGLRELLAEKPADPEGAIPFLPVFNAGQFMAAQVEYLDFQNGSGVRFLTQYGQDVWPVNNQGLFYTFQGLTSDGRYYVALILPVTHPSLPATGEEIMDTVDPGAFAEGFRDYLAEVEAALNAQDPASFLPDLATLDALIRSIRVEGW